MNQVISPQAIAQFKQQLEDHAVYGAINNLQDLRCFMQHHVYSVWDFMSLIKTLQSIIAPANAPWTPVNDASVRRFINELVLEEESDETHIEGEFSSHFELYLRAMEEIGADTTAARQFVEIVRHKGITAALESDCIPEPSRAFTRMTFDFIRSGNPHEVAAALALGREHVIPTMFRSILKRTGVTEQDAPIFHFYLNRHIHLDEDFHAPLSLRLLNNLCDDNEQFIQQATDAAERAISARISLWDGVLEAIQYGAAANRKTA